MPARMPSVCLLLAALLACAVHAQESAPADSLTARIEIDLATQEWRRADTEFPLAVPLHDGATLPLVLTLVDLETGGSESLAPAVWFEVDGRRRWGGRTLDVDWLLVLDQETGAFHRATFTLQLKAAAPRTVGIAAGVQLDLSGWRLHAGSHEPRRLNATEMEWSDSLPTSLGARGERARQPTATIQRGAGALLLAEASAEPRLFDLVARPVANFFGVLYECALSPGTTAFPGRAAFRFSLSSGPPPPATEPRPSTFSAQTADLAVASTRYPLVFIPRIRGSGAPGAPGAWTPVPLPAPTESAPDSVAAAEQEWTDADAEPLANFARDARVRFTAPTADPGVELDALADGIATADPERPETAGWRSTDAPTPHRIHLDFPAPTALTGLHLHWPVLDGTARAPRLLRISGRSAAGSWIAWPEVPIAADARTTRIELGSAQLSRLTIEMSAGAGPEGDPNRLWICELEVH